ncbi:MAG: glycosyltransferase family 2 protein [Planctomycetota bacterium]
MPPRLSCAIPVWNEDAVLPELLQRLGAVLDGLPGGPHEILLVDDGSTDRTPELLERAAAADPRVTVVQLSRNFGQQAAITAALDHARGDAVVVMDADLQDEPEAIPSFLERFAQGYDVVYARRVKRKESWLLRCSYSLAYRLINRLSEVRLPLDAGDFALLSRRVVDELKRNPEHKRYLRGLRAWVGFRQIGIDVERASRRAGRPKYTLFSLTGLMLDGIFSFSVVPLRLAGLTGALAVLACVGYAAYALYVKLATEVSPQGFTAIILVVVFLAGLQMLFLSLLGEYIGRIYEEVKRRPLYVVERVLRSDEGVG